MHRYGASGRPEPGLGDVQHDPELVEALMRDQENGTAELVELELRYDPIPPLREAKLWGIPLWLLAVGGVAWAINRYGQG